MDHIHASDQGLSVLCSILSAPECAASYLPPNLRSRAIILGDERLQICALMNRPGRSTTFASSKGPVPFIVAALQKFKPLVVLSGNFIETPARSWKLGAPGPER